MIEHLQRLPFVDRESIVVGGCSGGGRSGVARRCRTRVCAVVAEEPATVLTSGIFNNSAPRKGERYTPEDGFYLFEDGRRTTPTSCASVPRQARTADAPILLVQGDVDREGVRINRFNAEVLIPELRALTRTVRRQELPEQRTASVRRADSQRTLGARSAPASWPAAALQAFEDIDVFCRRQVRTKPKALDARLVSFEPV